MSVYTQHPINIDKDIIYKRMGNRNIPFLRIGDILRMPLPLYDLLKICGKIMKDNFNQKCDFDDFCKYFDVELSFYKPFTDKWKLVCQKICDEFVFRKQIRCANLKFHGIESYLCDEYRYFKDALFKLPIEIQVCIYNEFAKTFEKEQILENNYVNILSICNKENINEIDFYSKYCLIDKSDKYIYKIDDKYVTSNFSDFELFDILIMIAEELFKSIEIWNKYINPNDIIKNETIENVYAKAVFKKDFLNYNLSSKYSLSFIDSFYNLSILDDIFDEDFIVLIEKFFKFRTKFPWANYNIVKWFIFIYYPIYQDDKCFDAEDYFIMNYKLFYHKFKYHK